MPQTAFNRLQTPLRTPAMKKLSANFRPLHVPGPTTPGSAGIALVTTHGRGDARAALHNRLGVILVEANVKVAAAHTVEISQEAGTAYGAVGGTPAGATVTGGRAWDEIDYAAAGLAQLTASNSSPPAQGAREVLVP